MTGPMLPRDRCDFSAIVDRPAMKLPGGARIVIWSIVNLEVWDIGKRMARQATPAPTGIPLLPDAPDWSGHEHAMRSGVWLHYNVELNDILMIMVQHHESDHMMKRAIACCDRLYEESKVRPKILSLAVDPYISGQPFRIKFLEAIYDYVNKFDGVLHWNGEQILDWYKGQIAEQSGSKP